MGGNTEKKENTNIVASLNALSVTCCRMDTVGGVVIFSVTAGVALPSSHVTALCLGLHWSGSFYIVISLL